MRLRFIDYSARFREKLDEAEHIHDFSLSRDDFLQVLHLILLVVVGKHVEDLLASLWLHVTVVMEAFPADSAGEVQVLLHHGDAVCVDGAEVGILEEASQVALGSLLKGNEGRGLEAELRVDTVSDSADKALEGGLC